MEYSQIKRKVRPYRTYPASAGLFLLMSVFSKTLLTLVRCHFVLLSFLTAWHSVIEFFAPIPSLESMTRL
jgi:hypothetical protein